MDRHLLLSIIVTQYFKISEQKFDEIELLGAGASWSVAAAACTSDSLLGCCTRIGVMLRRWRHRSQVEKVL
jgi:hypothetical protein